MSEDNNARLVRERWDYTSPETGESMVGWHGLIHIPAVRSAVYFRTQELGNDHTGRSMLWEFRPMRYRHNVKQMAAMLPEMFASCEGTDDLGAYTLRERTIEPCPRNGTTLKEVAALATQRQTNEIMTTEMIREARLLCSRLGLGYFG